MVTYADYSYYKAKYNGLLEQPLFEKFAIRATLKIRNATNNRATTNNEDVKLCMCALVDTISENEKFTKNNLSSEKVDTYSRNFINKSKKDIEDEYNSIIKEYLGLSGLLSGGVCVVY